LKVGACEIFKLGKSKRNFGVFLVKKGEFKVEECGILKIRNLRRL
jgi:hypothetical protein